MKPLENILYSLIQESQSIVSLFAVNSGGAVVRRRRVRRGRCAVLARAMAHLRPRTRPRQGRRCRPAGCAGRVRVGCGVLCAGPSCAGRAVESCGPRLASDSVAPASSTGEKHETEYHNIFYYVGYLLHQQYNMVNAINVENPYLELETMQIIDLILHQFYSIYTNT